MTDEFGYLNQSYVTAVLAQARTYAGKPGLHHLMVEHDPWCPILSGTGYCVCRPTVRRPNRAERRRLARQVQP